MSKDVKTKRKLVKMQKLRHVIDRLRHTRKNGPREGQRSLLERIKQRVNTVLGRDQTEED